MKETGICRLAEIADPGSRGFTIATDGEEIECFVVRWNGAVFGYRNRCPHTGAPLDWMPDQFLDLSGTLIQCALHGALFEIASGRCIDGPCRGQALTPVALRVVDGLIVTR